MQKIIYRLFFILGLVSILLGLMFKIQHYPYSKNLLLVGFGFIGFVFAPLYFIIKLKEHNNKFLRALDFIGFFSLINISLGALLKVLDSGLGYYISLIGLITLVGLFIPLLFYIIVKNKENRLKRIIVIIVSSSYVLLSIYISTIINLKPQIIDSFKVVDQAIETQNINQYDKNQIDYSVLIENDKYKSELIRLRQQSDSICNYIQALKIEIVQTKNDSILNKILFKENKATILKKLIESHKDYIIKDLDNYIKYKDLNNFLSTKINNPNYSDSWEDEYFNHMPVEAVITVLSMIESNIRNVEREIIKNINKELRQLTNAHK